MTTPVTTVSGEWHTFDASSDYLGRLSTQIAALLMGKHRTDFARHIVPAVYVIVTNADALKVTGNKREKKFYRHYSGYPGGLKERSLAEQMRRDSTLVIREAVAGMLPKNNLRKEMLRHLKVYAGTDHPHLPQTQEN